MDKYEFNIKVEQLKKLVKNGDYSSAMQIADSIDWRRVHNTVLLSIVSEVYEKNEEYGEAKEILLLAYERAPIGKRLLYRLTSLAIKEGSISEAEAYYREFYDIAPEDSRGYILRYMILKAKNAPVEQLIHTLEAYNNVELDEKWMYELAELYHIAGKSDDCIRVCDNIMLMFGLGKYVDKAIELKTQKVGAQLTEYQQGLIDNREHYEEKLREVEETYGTGYIDTDSRTPELEETNEDEEEASDEDTLEASDEYEHEQEEGFDLEDCEQQEFEFGTMDSDEDETAHDEESLEKEFKEIESLSEKEPEISLESQIQEIENDIEAHIRELEEQEKLKAEISNMEKAVVLEDNDMEKTKVLGSIKSAISIEEVKEEEPAQSLESGELPEEDDLSEELSIVDLDVCEELKENLEAIVLDGKTLKEALSKAIELIKDIHEKTGRKNQVLKINASKLNEKGVLNSRQKIEGKDLIVEEAGDLSVESVKELIEILNSEDKNRTIILTDNPMQLKELVLAYPDIKEVFNIPADIIEETDFTISDISLHVKEETLVQEDIADKQINESKPGKKQRPVKRVVKESVEKEARRKLAHTNQELNIDEFADYACEHARRIDCSITGKSMLALYERIEIMDEDGIPLTRANAEALIEEAADKAEKPPLMKRILGIFSHKYNREGLLILKEEHFIS